MPPILLNMSADAHSINAGIDTVIIIGGPRSWKRDAYWDEYVLSISNYGEKPVVLTNARLIDFRGNPVVPGDNPWELQKQSREWIQNYNSGTTGVVLKVGAASVMTGLLVGGIAIASGGAGWISGVTIASVAAPLAVMAALPVIGIGTVLANVSARHKVEAEFNRRRLALPVTIQPGQVIKGSLFFRITPGPQQLSLMFTGIDPGFDVSIDLKTLSDLHIDTKSELKKPE